MPFYETTAEYVSSDSSDSFQHGGIPGGHGDDDIRSDLDENDHVTMATPSLRGPFHSGATDDDDFSMGASSAATNNTHAIMSQTESRLLSSAKCIVLICLFSLSGGVSYVWFVFADRNEEDTLRSEFHDTADHLKQVFLERIDYTLQTCTTISTAFTSSLGQLEDRSGLGATAPAISDGAGIDTNTWPFISFSDFERRVAASRRLIQASSVWFIPFVPLQQRQAWEDYATRIERHLYSAASGDDFSDPITSFAAPQDGEHSETQAESDASHGSISTSPFRSDLNWSIPNGIYRIQDHQAVSDVDATAASYPFYAPTWQVAPHSVANTTIMFNHMSESQRLSTIQQMQLNSLPLYSPTQLDGTEASLLYLNNAAENGATQATDDDVSSSTLGPYVSVYTPIFDTFQTDGAVDQPSVVGAISFQFYWIHILRNSIHGIAEALDVVLESTCNSEDKYVYRICEDAVTYLGKDDSIVFDNKLDLRLQSEYSEFNNIVLGGQSSTSNDAASVCSYRIRIAPTIAYENEFLTDQPIWSSVGVASIFILAAAVFVFYDCLVEKRQKRVMQFAKRSNAIVRSLFPAGVRDRLMHQGKNGTPSSTLPASYLPMQTPKLRLKTYLNDDDPSQPGNCTDQPQSHTSRSDQRYTSADAHLAHVTTSDPIADFWPNTTVLFADLSGFTAWSSTREPSQVFTLLETLYGAMDKAARRLGVFKVETVGDCYVAATGLPDPRDDHAILMIRFASVCLTRINELTRSLEAALGPGTGDLAMRMGVHSGPVTAGVLRGEKSRFQLFGDTMNTAARLESAGQRNRVHLSKETADLLMKGGKGHWVELRKDKIEVKGKGTMQTYWLKPKIGSPHDHSVRSSGRISETSSESCDNTENAGRTHTHVDESTSSVESTDINRRGSSRSMWNENDRRKRRDRLVEWNVEILSALLRRIVAKRSALNQTEESSEDLELECTIALDEVKEVIGMPDYDPKVAVKIAAESNSLLPPSVRRELREYIKHIAGFYNDNPFHNFEHASHVCLSANKLLKRIVMPDDVDYRQDSQQEEIDKLLAVSADLHQVTYGLSSDPVTQFAVVFSALIHDAGHTGVPNFLLAQEEPETSAMYRNQSIAEQRSVDLAWNLLMENQFDNLRNCLFPTKLEMTHFRQLIVNSVLATDIFDPQMTKLRKARWQKAFHPVDETELDDEDEAFNRKATIVIEHIIQASDVAHTMQHWHVYQKWNERLFQEMYAAYRDGRSTKDPSDGWYKGELWFFDNYVIPLAHKLKECGVFGVSSAEYLNYALQNREEWEAKGERVCQRIVANFESSRFAKK